MDRRCKKTPKYRDPSNKFLRKENKELKVENKMLNNVYENKKQSLHDEMMRGLDKIGENEILQRKIEKLEGKIEELKERIYSRFEILDL